MDKDELLRLAHERMNEAVTADYDNCERAEGDLQMLIGNQWPESVETERTSQGKPCLTLNRLPSFVRQVAGQIRNLNPGIQVVASDDEADKDVAEVIGGLIRHIENEADAASIYEQAAESAAACGIGHWRVRTQFAEGDTFDQEIVIERVYNPFSVFTDPYAKHPTRMDAQWRFIVEDIPLKAFQAQFPNARTEDFSTEHKPNNSEYSRTWFTGDTVSVAEYFWIEKKTHTIGQLPDGQIVRDPVAPMNVVRTRKVDVPQVKWAKITGAEVLEGPLDIPARWIPVFTVTGEEWHLGEETYRSSVIRFARDAQQLYNYGRSAHAELISLQPKAPYLVTTKQVAGLETFWNEANSKNRPYLPYNPDEKAGAPQRASPPVASSGLLQEIAIAAEDMKATTGIFDASLGNQSNETSGIAIQRRQMEAQNGTSVYADNMVKAILQTGKVLVDMIPKVYDTQRVVQILNESDQEKMVAINTVLQSQNGVVSVNDLTKGRYDVKISVGPSYETKREAAADGMMQFIRAVPQAAAVTSDLIALAQDWPDADKFAERLRKTLPTGMLSEENMTPEEIEARDQAAQIEQQQAAQLQQMTQAKAQAEIRGDMASAAQDEADARKTELESASLQLELAIKSGMLNSVIQQAVAQVLQGQLPSNQLGRGAI